MMYDMKLSLGVGFPGLLILLFITLKLTGHITWSWWWVLAPAWLPICVALLFALSIYVGGPDERIIKGQLGRK